MNNISYQKKTGILGGTFNPVHIGHLVLAQNAMEYCGLDKVLFIPSGCSYLKDPDEIADVTHRVNMTGLAIKNNERFELCTVEAEREGNSYTYETLDILNSADPDTRYYFIVGADTLMFMENWKEPARIFSSCSIICAMRDGLDAGILNDKAQSLKERFGADIILMEIPEIAVSSSTVRELLLDGKSARYYLDDAVIDYITRNGLYRPRA